jgi:hypothetical protein
MSILLRAVLTGSASKEWEKREEEVLAKRYLLLRNLMVKEKKQKRLKKAVRVGIGIGVDL